MRKTLAIAQIAIVLLGMSSTIAAQVPLESPAAVVWHEPTRAWFVANSGRPPGAEQPEGWIARLDGGDKKADPYWVRGLRGPRGMAAVGEHLYVADVTDLVVINVGARSVEKRLAVPGARLLHGVAVDPEGNVYVSDTLKNAIYRLRAAGAVPETFLSSGRLEGPTGLAVEVEALLVASWGVIADAGTLATRAPGRLLHVDLRSKAITPLVKRPVGNLDGLVVRDGRYIVTDRSAGKVLSISPAGEVTLIRGGLRGPGGIGLAARRGVLAIPERAGRNVVFLQLN